LYSSSPIPCKYRFAAAGYGAHVPEQRKLQTAQLREWATYGAWRETALTEDIIRRLINEELNKRYPHECPFCANFQMNSHPPTMRFCQFPGKVELDANEKCKHWALAQDLCKRKTGVYTQ
jgi:hypothetical protein